MDIKELILKHKGKRICVMGGSAALEEHMAQVQADVYISANGHTVDGIAPDYVVCMDAKHATTGQDAVELMRLSHSCPIISPNAGADYLLPEWPGAPKLTLSGAVAIWLAWAMGAKTVTVAGMDGYEGRHVGAYDYARSAVSVPVRIVGGGPLAVGSWGVFSPDEKFPKYQETDALKSLFATGSGLVVYEVIKRTHVGGRDVFKGEQVRMLPSQAVRLLKHGMIRNV